MMPNYKELKTTEVIGRILAHETSVNDKEEFHCQSPNNKSSGAYKSTNDVPKSSSVDKAKEVTSEELSLMVRNFTKMYSKNKFKDKNHNYSRTRNKESRSRNDSPRSILRERNCYNCGQPE
jgi:hypothetical protein